MTARSMKTVRSIIAKLRRQTTSLRQIQDLVGCRIVVPDIIAQEELLPVLLREFPDAQVVDRIATPQHGYRAIHIVIRNESQRFEVQLRSRLQDEWANLVEKLADRFGLDIKYGGGAHALQKALDQLSEKIAKVETIDRKYIARLEGKPPGTSPWVRLWISDFVVVVSPTTLPVGLGLLIEQAGEGHFEGASVGEQVGTFEGQWGRINEYAVDFSQQAIRDRITRDFEDAEVLYHEIQDMIESLEETF